MQLMGVIEAFGGAVLVAACIGVVVVVSVLVRELGSKWWRLVRADARARRNRRTSR